MLLYLLADVPPLTGSIPLLAGVPPLSGSIPPLAGVPPLTGSSAEGARSITSLARLSEMGGGVESLLPGSVIKSEGMIYDPILYMYQIYHLN